MLINTANNNEANFNSKFNSLYSLVQEWNDKEIRLESSSDIYNPATIDSISKKLSSLTGKGIIFKQ